MHETVDEKLEKDKTNRHGLAVKRFTRLDQGFNAYQHHLPLVPKNTLTKCREHFRAALTQE